MLSHYTTPTITSPLTAQQRWLSEIAIAEPSFPYSRFQGTHNALVAYIDPQGYIVATCDGCQQSAIRFYVDAFRIGDGDEVPSVTEEFLDGSSQGALVTYAWAICSACHDKHADCIDFAFD